MFEIGARQWPGISKLVEECGEVLQIAGKLMGTGGVTLHFSGLDLRRALEEELADLAAAIEFVIDHCGLDRAAIVRRRIEKLARFKEWHRGQREQRATETTTPMRRQR